MCCSTLVQIDFNWIVLAALRGEGFFRSFAHFHDPPASDRFMYVYMRELCSGDVLVFFEGVIHNLRGQNTPTPE